MNDYPLPASAVALWTAGETLYVRLPPSPGSDKGHVVALHADPEGLKNLLVILRQREVARASPKLGQPGAPTQYDLEAIRRAMVRAKPPAPKPRLTLEDLGL